MLYLEFYINIFIFYRRALIGHWQTSNRVPEILQQDYDSNIVIKEEEYMHSSDHNPEENPLNYQENEMKFPSSSSKELRGTCGSPSSNSLDENSLPVETNVLEGQGDSFLNDPSGSPDTAKNRTFRFFPNVTDSYADYKTDEFSRFGDKLLYLFSDKIDKRLSVENEDSDKLFLISLLPLLKNLNDEDKITARIEMIQVLQKLSFSKNKEKNGDDKK